MYHNGYLSMSICFEGLVLELWNCLNGFEYVERLPDGEVVQRKILPDPDEAKERVIALGMDMARSILPKVPGEVFYEGERSGTVFWTVLWGRDVHKRFRKLTSAVDCFMELDNQEKGLTLAACMTETDATGSRTKRHGWKPLLPVAEGVYS